MNKTITLIVAATVLMFTSVVVVAMAGDSIVGVNEDRSQLEKRSTCDFQISRAEKSGEWSRVNDNCMDQVPEESQDQAVAEQVDHWIT